MEIIFVRHGETFNSKNNLYQANNSSLLPMVDLKKSELAEHIAKLEPDQLVASELLRSKETAEILNSIIGLSILINPLLNEFREPSNLASKEITATNSYISKVISVYNNNDSYKYNDGESLNEFINRITNFRKWLENQNKEKIVCVGHGFFMRLFMLLTILNEDNITADVLYSLIKVKLSKLNCSSFKFSDGSWRLQNWNLDLHSLVSQSEE